MTDVIERLNATLGGRYRVEREVGKGGMATVYLADDLKHSRPVALKVLKPELAAAVGADRFLREIETTAALRHPHILPLYDSGHEEDVLYYVMPFIEGQSLRDRLEAERQLPVEDVLRILGSVTDALSHAHCRGIVHRDIKPENILLENGHAIMADFGIAQAVSESGGEKITQTGTILGTPLYMSPEQANADAVDERSDLYSLACVAYEMLAGVPPFTGPTGYVIIARHTLDPVPAIRTARPGIPPVVADAIERALAKTPADRFATVGEWREALRGSPAEAAEPEPDGTDAEVGLSLPRREKASIVILPFENLGSDPGQEFVADGIRFGIQATLVQLSSLFLVNASTPNRYRGSDASAETIGEELGVRYVLEGAAQQAGPRIRVTVQLTDVEARRVVWAERYEGNLDDVFKLQDEITRQVIFSLNLKLNYADQVRGWFGSLTNPEAHEYYYRGASHLYEGTREDNAKAREMFTELYRVQPDSVVGPSNLAATHFLDVQEGWSDDPEESLKLADHWAQKAMEYEDNNGIGHAIYGFLRLLERDYDGALDACSMSVNLRQSCPLAHGLRGMVLTYLGDPMAGVKEVREALSLEKVYPPFLLSALATAYRDGGEVDTSIAAAKESLRLDPQEMGALTVLCSDYRLAGRDDEAKLVAEDIISREPTFRLSQFSKGHPYKDAAPLDRFMGALREAGLPE